MIADARYRRQVSLLMRVLSVVAQEKCFALKGGTAINLFIRDMPRLSVDIDLAYLPILERDESLREIDEALRGIEARVLKSIPGSKVQTSVLRGTASVVKLVVNTADARIKVEVTPVLRGTVFPSAMRSVTDKVESEFGYAEISVVSFPDLYGGKIVAALDRQHPRDLYDVRLLLANEGISRELFQAFLVYLISHDRPMSEILAPNLRDIRQEFERGFSGMTFEAVTCDELERTREDLIERIHSAFTDDDKKLLRSIKAGMPDWGLLNIEGVDKLPAVRWKMHNLEKLGPKKREELLERLIRVLQ